MKIGDLYYNPEEDRLAEITGFSTIWLCPCVSYISCLHRFSNGYEMYASNGLPETIKEFKRKYRKIGVL